MQLVFNISPAMVESFARFTGDYNSLHMDEEFARKSKYRQRLVHGMLPFSFLAFLQQEFPHRPVEFTNIDTHFRQPIFMGDSIKLEVNYSETETNLFNYQAIWYRNNSQAILIKSKGNFHLSKHKNTQQSLDDHSHCFVKDNLSENTYTLPEIANKTDEFKLFLADSLKQKFRAHILAKGVMHPLGEMALDNNLLATLLLSTLVGMRLPGKHATFAKFKFCFQARLPSHELLMLSAKVVKISKPSESIELEATFSRAEQVLGHGGLNVVVNPPPQQTISCTEIKQNYLDMGITDKVVVITGASRGIGAATAKLFALHGAKVVVNYYRGKTDADSIAQEIEQFGGTALPLPCDIREESQVKEFVNCIVEKFGAIDILINNAVKEFIPQDYLRLEWHDYLSELEVSLKGMHNCCREIIPIFKQRKQGKIINLSTIVVDNPVTGQNKYITAKSAVEGYTKSLAKELVNQNIQVNLVAPNMTETDLVACIPSDFSKRIAASRAYGRHLKPIEVAQSILFLASNWADSLTGQKIYLNLGELPFG